MHHQPDFERDQDRERREGARGGRDDGRFEQQRGHERMESSEDFRQRGREFEHGDEQPYGRGQQGGWGGQHQQYSPTYGGQERYGGQGQFGGNQERYGSQGGYGGQGQFGGNQERYGNQGGYGQYGGSPERYGGQYGYGGGQYGGQYGYGNPGQQYGGNQYEQGQYGRFGNNQPAGDRGSEMGWGRRDEGSRMGSSMGSGDMSSQSGRSFEEGRGSERSRGQFRGKGPKDWTRSDERIREEVCELLADADEIDASEITVKVENGEVILDGTIDSRWAKREAEEIACRARGVKDCQNHLRVKSQSSSTGKEGTKESGNGHTQTSRGTSGMTSRATTA